jgi:hypothetical protein
LLDWRHKKEKITTFVQYLLQAVEMKFVRSDVGYSLLDKKQSEELKICNLNEKIQ